MSSTHTDSGFSTLEVAENNLIIFPSPPKQNGMFESISPQFYLASAGTVNSPKVVVEFTAEQESFNNLNNTFGVLGNEMNDSFSTTPGSITVALPENAELDGPIDLSSSTRDWPNSGLIFNAYYDEANSKYLIPAPIGNDQPCNLEFPALTPPNLKSLSPKPKEKTVQMRAQRKRKFTSYNDDKQWLPLRARKDPVKRKSDILEAARSLFAKRTRTLYRWLYPHYTKNEAKLAIDKAWTELPDDEKDFYFTQVLGRFTSQPRPLMVNPLLGRLFGKSEQNEDATAVNNLLRSENKVMSPAPALRNEPPLKRGRGLPTFEFTENQPGFLSNEDDEAIQALRQLRDEALCEGIINDPALNEEFTQLRSNLGSEDAEDN